MFTRTLCLFAVVALLAGTAKAADEPKSPTEDEVKAAQERLTEFLKGIKGGESGRVATVTVEGVGATFPDHVLFSVLFPQYPIARLAPPPLKSSNVIAIPKKKDGKPVPITTPKELEAFFKDSARAVK